MHELTSHVERKISERLPEKLAIIFDGWDGGNNHYVSVFSTFPSTNPCDFDQFLVALKPLGEEDCFDVDEPFEFLQFVLSVYNKSLENAVALLGDNANTNHVFARRIGPIFLRCHTHRYNLAMKDIIGGYSETIDCVCNPMSKLSNHITSVELRKMTLLKA